MLIHSYSVRSTVFAALFTALISVGAYLSIPVGPVPIVLQNFFVLLAGTMLGSSAGFSVVVTYLILGAIGLPVFHSGTGGIGIIMGPTGGYLLGYLPAVYITGLISEKERILSPCSFRSYCRCSNSICIRYPVAEIQPSYVLGKNVVSGIYPLYNRRCC